MGSCQRTPRGTARTGLRRHGGTRGGGGWTCDVPGTWRRGSGRRPRKRSRGGFVSACMHVRAMSDLSDARGRLPHCELPGGVQSTSTSTHGAAWSRAAAVLCGRADPVHVHHVRARAAPLTGRLVAGLPLRLERQRLLHHLPRVGAHLLQERLQLLAACTQSHTHAQASTVTLRGRSASSVGASTVAQCRAVQVRGCQGLIPAPYRGSVLAWRRER